MSKNQGRIAATLAFVFFLALVSLGALRATAVTAGPRTPASQPHVFVPTSVEIESSDEVPPPTF